MANHVLIIPSWYPTNNRKELGGFFRSQAIALSDRGNRVGVLSVQLRSLRHKDEWLSSGYGYHYYSDRSVPTYQFVGVAFPNRFPRINGCLWRYHGMKLFESYLRQHGLPDIVHIHSMIYAGSLALQIYREYGVPYVITEHSSIYERKLFNSSHLSMIQEISSNARHRIAISQNLCKLLEEVICGGGWIELPNMVDSMFLNEDLPETRQNSHAPFRFISIGGLHQHKGFNILIDAFSKYFKTSKNVKLKIVGQGPEKIALELMASKYGILEQVEFTGALDRRGVMEALRDSDVLVHPSHYETFGVALIEALALGRPVIATRCGGPEGIVTSVVGTLVPTNDAVALGIAMREMYSSYDKYEPKGIREYCRARYSEKSVLDELSALYEGD